MNINLHKQMTYGSYALIFSILLPMIKMPSMASNTEDNSKQDQESIVYRVYKDFAWEAVFAQNGQENPVLGDPLVDQPVSILRKYFDPDLAKLLVKDAQCASSGQVCKLDFDPIFASQDNMVFDLRIHLIRSRVVETEYSLRPGGKIVRMLFKLKFTETGWIINDIIYPEFANRSLRNILQGSQ